MGAAACLDLAILAVAVEAVDDVAKDLGNVDGDVQGADDPRVAVGQAVFDVIQRGVDQHATVVPCRTLHPDCLMHCAQRAHIKLTTFLVATKDYANADLSTLQWRSHCSPKPQKKEAKLMSCFELMFCSSHSMLANLKPGGGSNPATCQVRMAS